LHAAILLAFSSCLKLFLYGVSENIRKLHYITIQSTSCNFKVLQI